MSRPHTPPTLYQNHTVYDSPPNQRQSNQRTSRLPLNLPPPSLHLRPDYRYRRVAERSGSQSLLHVDFDFELEVLLHLSFAVWDSRRNLALIPEIVIFADLGQRLVRVDG